MPLNDTVSGATPEVGFALTTATGGVFALAKLIRRIVPPSKST